MLVAAWGGVSSPPLAIEGEVEVTSSPQLGLRPPHVVRLQRPVAGASCSARGWRPGRARRGAHARLLPAKRSMTQATPSTSLSTRWPCCRGRSSPGASVRRGTAPVAHSGCRRTVLPVGRARAMCGRTRRPRKDQAAPVLALRSTAKRLVARRPATRRVSACECRHIHAHAAKVSTAAPSPTARRCWRAGLSV